MPHTLSNGAVTATFKLAPVITETGEPKTEFMAFDGRTFPLAYFGANKEETRQLEFFVNVAVEGDQYANLQLLMGQVCVWTDAFGSSINCVVTSPSRDYVVGGPTPGQYQRVRFKLTKVE